MLLEKLWDDVVAGPHHDRGLGKLRKISTTPLNIKDSKGESSKFLRSLSITASPVTPSTPGTPTTPVLARKDNVWWSVFYPGSNLSTSVNAPTVYDWLYSGETRSKPHH